MYVQCTYSMSLTLTLRGGEWLASTNSKWPLANKTYIDDPNLHILETFLQKFSYPPPWVPPPFQRWILNDALPSRGGRRGVVGLKNIFKKK